MINVWVSAFLNPHGLPGQVMTAVQQGRFTLLESEALLAELAEVLARPRMARRHRRGSEQIAAFVGALRQDSEPVQLTGTIHICRDPADDAVIETAIRGGAACVVSGDRDAHAREVVDYLAARGVVVLTVREFVMRLETTEALEQAGGDIDASGSGSQGG